MLLLLYLNYNILYVNNMLDLTLKGIWLDYVYMIQFPQPGHPVLKLIN